MSTSRPEFGNRALSDPALSAELARWIAEDRDQAIRENNDRLYREYIRRFFGLDVSDGRL